MKFHTVQSFNDDYFNKALDFYNRQLDIDFYEDSSIIKKSLQNNKTENDYAFIVGLDDDEVISIATAHYEATTNSAFLIHLLAMDHTNHDEIISETIEEIEIQLNKLSNKVHSKDINFIMTEVPQEINNSNHNEEKFKKRLHSLLINGFEKQSEIEYLHPNYSTETSPFEVDLFIKSNIELTKDIYPASVKSNYILKYVFANGISRDIIYPLLERMNLRFPL